jgi:hypothetical protein
MTDYRKFINEDCRRLILEALSKEPSSSLNEGMLSRVLEAHGHRKPIDYVREQIEWLGEREAVHVTEVAGLLIPKLLTKGLEHVERRALIPGVAKPALEA